MTGFCMKCNTGLKRVTAAVINNFGMCRYQYVLCRYNSRTYYERNSELRRVIDQIAGDFFAPKGTFEHIADELLERDR